MSNTCIVCDSLVFMRRHKSLRQCLKCGHVIAEIEAEKTSFKDIYSPKYFKGEGDYCDYLGDRKCHEKNFYSRLKDILFYCPKGKLLEIGSAYGLFLALAKKYYFPLGYEICKEAADFAKKEFDLNVQSDDFLAANLPEGSFDVIVMWDVLEHLPNPQDFVAKIYRLLKKDGILALTTGDIGSFFARHRGEKWRLIHPPTHLHYFSKKSITRLLSNYSFNILKISYPGYWRSFRFIFYRLFAKGANHSPLLSKFINVKPLANLSVYFNFFDIMQVIAKK